MKLWQKIFLMTLTLVIIVVNVSSMALLVNSHSLTIEREQQSAAARHNYIDLSLTQAVVYEQLNASKPSLSYEETTATANEVFQQQQSDTTVGFALYLGQDRVAFANQDENGPQSSLLNEPAYTSIISELNGVTYLYIVSSLTLNEDSYQLVSSFDITATGELFRADFEQTRFIGIVSALIVAGLLLMLVRGLLSPLRSLSNTTSQIANGDLGKRAVVSSRDEVADVARNFNVMADSIEKNVTELAELAEARRVFIGNLAHEMKTPLTSILGFADILRIKREVSDADRIEYASVIVSETKRLQGLSGKLMELLTMGNLQITSEIVEVHDFANELSTILQPIVQSHAMKFETRLPKRKLRIRIDRELMKSLIFNLVDNSIKASKHDSNIRLEFSDDQDAGRVKIAVTDEGTGIPADEIQSLMEPFYMLDKARTRKFGGAGLGLALCYEIAKAHNSELKIESEQGKGTEISISLVKEGDSD